MNSLDELKSLMNWATAVKFTPDYDLSELAWPSSVSSTDWLWQNLYFYLPNTLDKKADIIFKTKYKKNSPGMHTKVHNIECLAE